MVSHETLHFKNRSVFNTIGFIIMIGVNALAVQLPINGKTTAQISEEYPNLFAPAGITFLYGALFIFPCWLLLYTSYGYPFQIRNLQHWLM